MRIIITILLLTLAANTANAGDCKYSRDIQRVVDLGSVTELMVEAGAGSLEISGDSSRSDVQIEANICSSDEDFLDKMDVISDVKSSTAHFETVFPHKSFWDGNEQASINLVLTVPASSLLDVQDSSGEALVQGVAKLVMTDSSGQLTIKNISGDVKVRDSSGALKLQNIDGDVEVTDSSGGIYVTDVKGNLLVIADSSGEIEAKRIGKDVIVKRDSSGAIEVKDVQGNFTVEKDSSGGITYKNVVGKVNIPSN
jgi:hypothetical protein